MNKIKDIKDQEMVRKMKELEEDIGYELFYIKEDIKDIYAKYYTLKERAIYLAVFVGVYLFVKIFNVCNWT